MTADSFKQRLLELALELRDATAATFDTGADGACDRCHRDGFEPTGLETETVIEYYALVCPAEGCDGEVTFAHLFVAAGDGPRVVNRAFTGVGCTESGCDPSAHLGPDDVRDERPFRRLEYHLPVTGLLENPVRERRAGADPERTLELCRACHARIRDEDERSDPEPAAPGPQ